MRKLALAIAAYAIVYGAFAAWRWHIWTFGTDTGTFAQVVGDAFGGFADGPEQGTHFRFHWAPLLAILWPLVVTTRSPLALQFAQIVLIALCALPLYGTARAYVDRDRAFAYASLALLYPPLGAVAFTEFHEIAFYPALALGLVWAAERARWGWFAVFAVCAALVREEACIVLACVGLAFTAIGIASTRAPAEPRGRVPAASRGRARGEPRGLLAGSPREPERLVAAGLGLTVVNALALFVYYRIVIPHVGAWQPSRFYEYPFAHGPAQLVTAILVHPGDAAAFLTLGRFTYLLEALVPLAFLPLFSRWSLLAVPGLLIVLLSSDPIAWRMGSHYAAIWCPWLLLGAVAALVARGERVARRWWRAAAALCLVFLAAFNPMHVAHYIRPIYAHDDAARALALVPSNAHLVTHDEWFAHVAYAHRNATVFFCPFVDYVVYANDYPGGYYHAEIVPEIAREIASGQMHAIARFGHVTAYRRVPDPGARVGSCVTPGDVRYRSLRSSLSQSGSSTTR